MNRVNTLKEAIDEAGKMEVEITNEGEIRAKLQGLTEETPVSTPSAKKTGQIPVSQQASQASSLMSAWEKFKKANAKEKLYGLSRNKNSQIKGCL